jgi:hypothetical protein
MTAVASVRDNIRLTNYGEVTNVYNGPVVQNAPSLVSPSTDSQLYKDINPSPAILKRYLENTSITSTSGKVVITADFVKKGLLYQPTYTTQFNADFKLKNNANEESAVSFFFPFPNGTYNAQISNAKLTVDGQEYLLAKASQNYYGPGLKWEGKIPAQADKTISVSYETVGLGQFRYQGFENTKGSQDFNFDLTIKGTRAYNVVDGLSVDQRKFEDNAVTLSWNKQNLYSVPQIHIEVGNKINPSEQVSRVYLTMTPVYLFFGLALVYLTKRFGKGLRILDLSLITILFVLFFPLFHYLTSFTIDPTSEIFANMNVGNYSMPLYLAFAIAFAVIAGLIVYLLSRTQSSKFALKLGLPVVAIALGFFPLVATIPEYFMLLVLIGFLAILSIAIQVRLSNK